MIVSYSTLLTGYNPITTFVVNHNAPVTEAWNSRMMQNYFIDGMLNVTNLTTLVYEIIIALFILVVIFALGYTVLGGIVRRFSQW